jgi:lipopolysaccharide export system protein LptA
MNRFTISVLISLLFITTRTESQGEKRKPAEINILNAESMEAPYPGLSPDAIRLIGNVRLSHEDVLMSCDSAHRYANTNIVNAFGNVHINQGDTLHLYGDRITYYGNRRYAEVRRNVRLQDRETTLTTEYLDFNLQNDYGHYPNRGIVINGDNRLESIKGYYYTNEKMFYFQDSVLVTNPDYVIKSDTLKYNTITEVAYFLGPTTIIGDNINIYCENGWYNTQTDIAQFNENARVTNNEQVISADSLFYDNRNGMGEAFINIEVNDTTENILLKGDYAWFEREPEHMFITRNALFIQMSDNDTLYLHADTLRSWIQFNGTEPVIPEMPDTIPVADNPGDGSNPNGNTNDREVAPPADTVAIASPADTAAIASPADTAVISSPADTVAIDSPADTAAIAYPADTVVIAYPADTVVIASPADTAVITSPSDTTVIASPPAPAQPYDTVRMLAAYYGVRFFSNEMQGKCDSLYYNVKDSVIHMFYEPVIWSGGSQLSAEYMEIHSKNGDVEHVIMKTSAFIVSEENPGLYNQISGKDMFGYVREGELYRVDVSGNAETLYYPLEEDGVVGINKAASANLIIFLKENKPDRIRLRGSPGAILYPMEELPPQERLLRNFQWLDEIRPKSKEDVFK